MSVKVSAAVWERSRHTGADLLTLLAIADFCDDAGVAWPSMSKLARKTRLDERSVYRIIRRLLASGELVRTKAGGGSKTAQYRIEIPSKSSESPLTESQGMTQSQGMTESQALTESTVTPDRKYNFGGPYQLYEPSRTITSPNGVRSKPQSDPNFDRFYELYPRHEGRIAALKAWQKLKPNPGLADLIVKHVDLRKQTDWRDRERKHIPLPASFINGRRWEDEIGPGANGSGASRPLYLSEADLEAARR